MVQNTHLIKKHREKKVIEFIESNRNENGYFKCPCENCHYFFGWSYGGEERNVLFGFLRHLLWEVRVKGSKKHMDIFIELFGKEESIRRFEWWYLQSLETLNNIKEKLEELWNTKSS